MIPFPVPIAVSYLKDHPLITPILGGERVSTELSDVLPALRVTLLPAGTPKDWQWTTTYLVDAWAEDELDAGDLIARVRAAWPGLRGYVLDGGAFVSGAWVEMEPQWAGDRDTDLARYQITVSCHVHPPKEV